RPRPWPGRLTSSGEMGILLETCSTSSNDVSRNVRRPGRPRQEGRSDLPEQILRGCAAPGLSYRHTGRAPKRVTTVAATRVANSAALARSARAGLAGRPPRVAAGAASQRLMKAPQKASPAPVVSVARAGCAAIGTGVSPGTASMQPAPPIFTTTTL